MKIHILYNFQEGPTGGGNQFLKALKGEWQRQGIYEENLEKADIVLFNSHHCLKQVFWAKKKFPQKIFIHRIDGPIQLYRGKDQAVDNIIFKTNKLLADGVVFQSNWSKKENCKLHQYFSKYEKVIFNAPDQTIFNKVSKKDFKLQWKIKLIAVSWSDNFKKGFNLYQYLDEHLDFKKYEMSFVGNSPVVFKNIKIIKPVLSRELANILKQNDIYITASQKDPCSNSLIEALSCGLPATVLNDGGHPELLQKGGELFTGQKDIIEKIEKVAQNYYFYQKNLPEFFLDKVAREYFNFAKQIFDDSQSGYYFPRQVGVFAVFSFYFELFKFFFFRLIGKIKNKYGY